MTAPRLITGETGPYTATDGPGWYGRNAAVNAKKPLVREQQAFHRELFLTPLTEMTLRDEDFYNTSVRHSQEKTLNDQLIADAFGYGVQQAEQEGPTRTGMIAYMMATYFEPLAGLLTQLATGEKGAELRDALKTAFEANLNNHFALLDRNSNDIIDPEEGAALTLLMDDPAHTLKDVVTSEEQNTPVARFEQTVGQTVETAMADGSSLLDGCVSNEERLLINKVLNNTPDAVGRAMDRLIETHNLKDTIPC
ncbi:MAG: hypothetical protein AB7P76_10805 [Candidatus Melainabacteria bacterium]